VVFHTRDGAPGWMMMSCGSQYRPGALS